MSRARQDGGPSFDEAELLRVTLASIGDGVITTDRHGNVTFLNPVAEALTGWTEEQAAGRSLTEVFRIVNEETRDEVENPALRALAEGLIVGLANHTLLIARDGTERPIDDSAAPIRDAQGRTAGAVLVFRDVTARRQHERTVRAALDFARNVVATLRHAFLVLDGDLRVISANRAFYRAFRSREEETVGRLLHEMDDRQWDIPRLRESLQDVLRHNRAFEDLEVEHDFARVGRKVLALNARCVEQPGDRSPMILLVLDDVTERRRAEAALRESELRYRRLFQTAKDGILILDARTGKILDANAFMVAMTGLEYGELLGKELYEIGLYKDVEENKEAFRKLQREAYLRYEHLPILKQTGETMHIEMIANVYQEDHRPVAQCNIRDISERVAMQKRIAQQAEAIAGESRRKDEFLAMLSHELRNPLAPIRAAVHLLRSKDHDGGVNAIQKQAHEIIERQVASLTKLVSDLLEVSRVVSGRIRLNQQNLNLSQIVRHAIETTQPLFEQRRHTLSLELDQDAVWVSADPTRMEEVFINLLNNAAKYTPDGGRVEVRCEHPRGTNYAQVRVVDTGIGIDPELLPRIFDLFSQADRSLDRAAGGLGIGLSLAHRLVNLHGGTIEARSPPEGAQGGSEFVVRLPLASRPQLASATHGQAPAREPGGVRILVVDDNIDFVTMLCGSLQQRGHSVQVAYTGPEALRIAREWRPQVVLLDIGLPGLDGYNVARQLRSDDPGVGSARTRLIAITGYGRETDVALAREAGFDGHLTKPIDFEDLYEAITRGDRP